MITEYQPDTDSFCIRSRSGTPMLWTDAEGMRTLLETAQYAVAKRFELTGRTTL